MKSVAMQEQVKYCMSLFRNMTKKYQKRAKNSQKTALHETLKTNSTLLKVQSQDFFLVILKHMHMKSVPMQ